jgi:hypothetical protein
LLFNNSSVHRSLHTSDQDLNNKKSAYFTHPDFSAAKLGKKSAQIMRVNTVLLFNSCIHIILFCIALFYFFNHGLWEIFVLFFGNKCEREMRSFKFSETYENLFINYCILK